MRREVIAPIYAESFARRKLPANFNQDHLPLFEGELERRIPESSLLKFQNILASPEGLLFDGTSILRESFAFPYHLDQWKRRSVLRFLVTNYVFRKRRTIDADALWITDYWSTGYFHWLADALTRLFTVRDRLSDLLLVLPAKFQTFEFVESSLKAFGVTNVDFIGADEFVEFRSLLLPTHTAPSGHYNAEAIRGVRSVLLSAYGDESGEGERLYISRGAAGKRRIINEDEIAPILSKFGFKTVRTEELSFDQQVRICSRARYVISNHGAGLTNTLFMREGGSVLELRHQSDRINNCFFTLASALELNYFYQTCAPHDTKADPHEADLLVDTKALEANLRLITAE